MCRFRLVICSGLPIKTFLLLLIALTLFGCKPGKEDSYGNKTEMSVLLSADISDSNRQLQDSLLTDLKLPGTDEPFFSDINFRSIATDNIPRTANILIVTTVNNLKNSEELKGIFSEKLLKRVVQNNTPVFLKKDNLFYDDQLVWFILCNGNDDLSRFLKEQYNSVLATVMSTNISKIISKAGRKPRIERDLKEEVTEKWGIELQVPEGFESAAKPSDSYTMLRRGAGTKTEEWIFIAEIKGFTPSAVDSSGGIGSSFRTSGGKGDKNTAADKLTVVNGSLEKSGQSNKGTATEGEALIGDENNSLTGMQRYIADLRDSLLLNAIKYNDGSRMRTTQLQFYSGDKSLFRGMWETNPYPMAGLFSGRVLKKEGRSFYLEVGVYSPGRNKTLNLLRLEKVIRSL